MPVKLNPPSSTVVVTVADDAADKYLAAGWRKVAPAPEPTVEKEKASEAPARRRAARGD
ncbi:hypothetical protein [Micrococcus sp.]|uniref:hypothetical protein n=1 Tax=Micrococcus sp. TaxID=1271 RepID=UPI002A913B71|nr:hypothetical protein [Micrococcus sp.]MDY6054349.1 hypothetical protein [Micrococcus sp.]